MTSPREAEDGAVTGEGHQLDLAFLAGFKAYRRARRDIQAIAGGLLTVELQRRVNLGEMVVRTDLNRPIAVVLNDHATGCPAGIQGYLTGLNVIFTGDHGATSDNRVVNGDQLRAVREGGFDTDIRDHFRTPSITCSRVRT